MKATDRIIVRDGYYNGPVDRPIAVEDAIKTGVNYGASALNQLKAVNAHIAALEKMIAEIKK